MQPNSDSEAPPNVSLLGHVISVHGSQAGVGFPAPSPQQPEEARATVGKFLGIISGNAMLVGIVTDIHVSGSQQGKPMATAKVDLIGEIRQAASGRFDRGISRYPAIGDPAIFVGPRELQLIFQRSGDAVEIGHLQQNPNVGAFVNVGDLVSKHFAVLGTTGVGKSCAVTLMLQEILRHHPGLRVFVLDVHNEYGRCFGDLAQVLNPSNVRLPFWLFNFDEFVEVLFGGRPEIENEVDILSEVIPLAKAAYCQGGASGRVLVKSSDPSGQRFTVDVPVPYRIADLISLLDARMGKLENRSSRMIYQRLITRIDTAVNDPRYAFMFESANVGGDSMAEVLGTLFRIPEAGKSVTVMQLAGFPSEIVDAVVSVTCRMAFDLGLWSDGAFPLLLVCEEAHRYMAVDHSVGFAPTRHAISRIAKEGRKYGVYLGLVTQRPAELDPTILSQCSTLFAMRMTNDRDQALLKSAVADTAANLLAFLPSLSTGEAFAFGEGMVLPTRLRFNQLDEASVPRSEIVTPGEAVPSGENQGELATAIERWRGRLGKRPPKWEAVAEQLRKPQVPNERHAG